MTQSLHKTVRKSLEARTQRIQVGTLIPLTDVSCTPRKKDSPLETAVSHQPL